MGGVEVQVVQMNFLKLLSVTARQTFTYHCLNSAAWLNGDTGVHHLALRFRGSDGEELTHSNAHYIRALYDGCQVSGKRANPHCPYLPVLCIFHSICSQTSASLPLCLLPPDLSTVTPLHMFRAYLSGFSSFGFKRSNLCYSLPFSH